MKSNIEAKKREQDALKKLWLNYPIEKNTNTQGK